MSAIPPSPRRCLSRRFLIATLACLGVTYGGLLVVLCGLEDRLLYHPVSAGRRWVDPPPGCVFEDVPLRTAEGTRIHARWLPCSGADGAVLICHSRSGNLSLALRPDEIAGWHTEIGVSVLLFDYPGYGRSEGRPSESGCCAAADAACDWLTRTKGIAPRHLLIFGRSLGSAVAVDVANRQPCRALVLVSPFTSLPDVAWSQLPFLPTRRLMRNRFDSLAKIGRCPQPLFIVHGTHDRLVPFALGDRLFAAAREPRRFLRVEGAHHGDCIRPEFFVALRRFLAEVEGGGRPAHPPCGRSE